MKIHAIQTGSFIVKNRFCNGKGIGPLRLLNIFLDRTWTQTLPYYTWVIEHPEGIIVIDTGETARALQPDYYPLVNRTFIKKNAKVYIHPEDEIGPRMEALGIKPGEVRWVILTHMHQDHIGGLRYFPQAKILVSRQEYKAAQSFGAHLQGYMPKNWPGWFNPCLIDYSDDSFGVFPKSFTLTKAGDIHLVPTQGHSPGHLSVILKINGLSFFFAGDVSFNQQFLLSRTVAGVSESVKKNRQTLELINQYVIQNPTVYLPSHDPDASSRLASRTKVCI